ncbi:MAG: hypothetical protein LIR50_03015 [Bacillota bacterium]|nr:hypothetical protein [Bacillota bacterium]
MINPINEVVLSDAFNARLNALSKTTYVDSQIASVIQQLQTGDANVFNNSKIYTDDKVASLVSSAPSTLDTLNELATALGDDPNFATTMSNQIGKKADKILVPVNNNILIMDENGNLKDSGIASSNVGQLSISKDWSALQNFNAGAFVNIATNKYNASELINSYPKGYSMMWLNATNGFPITTGYGFVITFNIGTCGYQEVVEMYTGADTTVKQRRWFRTKKDANNFWQPFQEIWTSGFMGAGSTLDADKLDGKEGSYYSDYTNLVNKPDVYTKTEMNGIVNGLATKNDLNVAVDDINTDIGSATLSTNDKTVKGAINEVKNAIPTSLPANGGHASTADKFQTARNIALTGDVTGNVNFDGSTNANITTSLKNSGVTAGTYRSVTVDAKGRVTTGTNPTTRDGYGLSDVPTKTEVDNSINDVQIGGRNLYKGTKDLSSPYWTIVGASIIDSTKFQGFKAMIISADSSYIRSDTSAQGFDFSDTSKTWTISAYFFANADNQKVGITVSTSRVNWQQQTIPAGKYTKLSWTFTGDGNTVQGFRFETTGATSSANINIAKIKVEEGNKATDWTPAPEDTQAQIDNINTTIGSATLSTTDKTVKGAINEIKNKIPIKTSQITNDGDGTSNFVTANQLGSAGYGDMTKAQYDTNSNGVVDKAEKLATARKINGVNFDGTNDINISASANGGTSSFLGNAVNVSDYNALNPSVIAQGNITPIKAPNTANSPWNNTTSGFLIQSNDNDSFHILIFRSGGDGWAYRSWYQGTWSSWKIWSTFDGNYNSLSNKPDVYTKTEVDNKTSLNRIDITGQTVDINNFNLSSGSPNIQLYICKTMGGSANISNIPVTNTNFILNVELIRYVGSGDYITRQSFINTVDKGIYTRFCISGNWSSWSRIVQEYDLQRITQDTSTQPTNQSTGGVWLKPV